MGIGELEGELRRFAEERDWEQFHAPKNLAIALAVEAAELLEHFQWLTEEESGRLDPARLGLVRGELADVFIYLVRLAGRLGVDLEAAAREKMLVNAERYPVSKSRGNKRKWSELG
jgi:NTP pyrophosphatase (non-canonical NTP hydrolase)